MTNSSNSNLSPSDVNNVAFGSPAPNPLGIHTARTPGLSISATIPPADRTAETSTSAGNVENGDQAMGEPNTTTSIEVSQTEIEVRNRFAHVKVKWSELQGYLRTGRQERLNIITLLQERIVLYGNLSQSMSPAQFAVFNQVIIETESTLRSAEEEIRIFDSMVTPEKEWICGELNILTQRFTDIVKMLIQEYDWPTQLDCQEIGLSNLVWRTIQQAYDTTPIDMRQDHAAIIRQHYGETFK